MMIYFQSTLGRTFGKEGRFGGTDPPPHRRIFDAIELSMTIYFMPCLVALKPPKQFSLEEANEYGR